MSIRAFLFDMDGLLLDTEAIHIRAYAELTARLGCPQSHETLKRFIGYSHLVACKWLMEEAGCPGPMEELIEAEQAIYFDILENEKPEPLPGVGAMFDACDRMKFSRALVSSSVGFQVDPTMQIITTHLKRPGYWREHFQSVCTGDRVKERKPAPDLYQLAMQELNVKPHECLAFEDSSAGIEAALNANLRVVAVPNLHLNADEVVKGRTDLVFKSLSEVAENLDRILK